MYLARIRWWIYRKLEFIRPSYKCDKYVISALQTEINKLKQEKLNERR